MPRLSREIWVNLILVLSILLAALAAWLAGEIFYINLTTRIAIVAMAAVGLNLALGFGGMVSFGHAAFFGIGGYVAGIAAFHSFEDSMFAGLIPSTDEMLFIWLIAAAVSALAAFAIGAISLRTRGVYFIMITLAFAQMIYYFAISFPAYGGEDGLPIYLRNQLFGLNTDNPLLFFFLCFTLLLATLFVCSRLLGARFGAALTMAKLNEERLATAGIEPYSIRLAGFVLSAVIVGVAGALFADLNGFVGPSMLSWHRSGEIMVIVILGGVGRLFGPLAGAIAFVLLETFLGGLTQHWQFFLGLILLGVVMYARGGLMGLFAGRARHG
ncbi:MAG: branched-chain amino acid ABC transporter permease [Pseudomonadota bacterium]